jgi:hypothetical protein
MQLRISNAITSAAKLCRNAAIFARFLSAEARDDHSS